MSLTFGDGEVIGEAIFFYLPLLCVTFYCVVRFHANSKFIKDKYGSTIWWILCICAWSIPVLGHYWIVAPIKKNTHYDYKVTKSGKKIISVKTSTRSKTNPAPSSLPQPAEPRTPQLPKEEKDRLDKLAKERVEKERYEEKFKDFKISEGRTIQKSIQELIIQKESLAKRIQEMESIIKQAGRNPEEDKDLKSWKSHQENLSTAISKLEKSLIDLFISYQKKSLTTTAGEKENYEKLLQAGTAEATLLEGEFRDIIKELSGEEKDNKP